MPVLDSLVVPNAGSGATLVLPSAFVEDLTPQTFTAGPFVDVAGCFVDVTLAVSSPIWGHWLCNIARAGGGNPVFGARLHVTGPGGFDEASIEITVTVDGNAERRGIAQYRTLGPTIPGTYRVQAQGRVVAGPDVNYLNGELFAFGLGALTT